jgi:allantoin racemase
MSVLDLEGDPEEVASAIAAEAACAIKQDRAEVIVLGCGGMAGLDAKVRDLTGAPTVDGVAAAVKIAEDLVQLGLTTSKVRTYAPPRPKAVHHWPLHKDLRRSAD